METVLSDGFWVALEVEEGRAPKSPERASGMNLTVQVLGHWRLFRLSVSRRVRRDSLVLSWFFRES